MQLKKTGGCGFCYQVQPEPSTTNCFALFCERETSPAPYVSKSALTFGNALPTTQQSQCAKATKYFRRPWVPKTILATGENAKAFPATNCPPTPTSQCPPELTRCHMPARSTRVLFAAGMQHQDSPSRIHRECHLWRRTDKPLPAKLLKPHSR